MLEIRHRQIESLADDLSKRGIGGVEFISALVSAKISSRTASSLARECSVHLAATAQLIRTLLTELSAWAASRPTEQDATTARIDQVGWNMAVASIQRCIDAVAVDNTEQIWRLARVIAEKTVDLIGGQYARSLLELANMLEDINNVMDIKYADHRTTTKILGTFELFMMSCLSANQIAVAQVRALTESPATPSDILLEPFEITSKRVMGSAKKVVIEYIHQSRGQIEAVAFQDDNVSRSDQDILFPADGWWPNNQVQIND